MAHVTAAELPESYISLEEYREENRMWWHERVAAELRRLHSECATPAYSVAGVASNIGLPVRDVHWYVRQMLLWGEVRLAEPLWDYAPASWVRLAASEVAA